MIRLLFLIPLVLSVLWILYLKANNYSLKQGKQGFIYILVFSSVIALFYMIMMWITQAQ